MAPARPRRGREPRLESSPARKCRRRRTRQRRIRCPPRRRRDISQVHEFDELPAACQAYVKRLEDLSNCRISVIGTGPQRDHIISVHSLLD